MEKIIDAEKKIEMNKKINLAKKNETIPKNEKRIVKFNHDLLGITQNSLVSQTRKNPQTSIGNTLNKKVKKSLKKNTGGNPYF